MPHQCPRRGVCQVALTPPSMEVPWHPPLTHPCQTCEGLSFRVFWTKIHPHKYHDCLHLRMLSIFANAFFHNLHYIIQICHPTNLQQNKSNDPKKSQKSLGNWSNSQISPWFNCQIFQVTLLRFPRVFGWLRKVVHKNETSEGRKPQPQGGLQVSRQQKLSWWISGDSFTKQQLFKTSPYFPLINTTCWKLRMKLNSDEFEVVRAGKNVNLKWQVLPRICSRKKFLF